MTFLLVTVYVFDNIAIMITVSAQYSEGPIVRMALRKIIQSCFKVCPFYKMQRRSCSCQCKPTRGYLESLISFNDIKKNA